MRLLLASDLHTDLDACRALVAQADTADLLIIAGDLASQHQRLGETVAALAPATPPTILIPGNNETPDALRAAAAAHFPTARVLHAQGATIAGRRLYALGGGIPPINQPWSHDLHEHDADALLDRCDGCDILITHAPPQGHGDHTAGAHRGSTAILRALHRLRPALSVFGHIHDQWGSRTTLGPTTCINAGPRGAWFDL